MPTGAMSSEGSRSEDELIRERSREDVLHRLDLRDNGHCAQYPLYDGYNHDALH